MFAGNRKDTKKVSVHSTRLSRAMTFNRECQRLHHLEQTQLSTHQHRTRCGLNSEINQLKAEMYKIRVKTPTLEDSMRGKALSGVEVGLKRASADSKVSITAYEVGSAGSRGSATTKKKARSGSSSAATLSRQTSNTSSSATSRVRSIRSAPPEIPTTEEMQEKIARFFDKNKEYLEPPKVAIADDGADQTTASGTWARGSKSARAFYSATDGSSPTRGPLTATLKINSTGKRSPVDSAPPLGPLTKQDLMNIAQEAWRSYVSAGNPYQAFFKPEMRTLNLAHRMGRVSRKIRKINSDRERKAEEKERTQLVEEKLNQVNKKKDTGKTKGKQKAWVVEDSDSD